MKSITLTHSVPYERKRCGEAKEKEANQGRAEGKMHEKLLEHRQQLKYKFSQPGIWQTLL